MSRRQLKTDDELGFIRAYRDEVLDTEAMYGVRVTCQVELTSVAEAIVIVMRATGVPGRPLEGAHVVAEYRYPSHSASRLHAALYGAAIRLNVAIQHEHRNRYGEFTARPSDEAPNGA